MDVISDYNKKFFSRYMGMKVFFKEKISKKCEVLDIIKIILFKDFVFMGNREIE